MYRLLAEQTVWPVLGLLIFITVFVVAVIRAIKLDKKDVEHLEQLPLDSDSTKTKELFHG